MKNLLFFLLWLSSLAVLSQSIVWEKTFIKSRYDQFGCVRATRDGGCIWGGYYDSDYYTDSIPAKKISHKVKGKEVWIVKLNSNGEMEWEKSYGDEIDDSFVDLRQTSDGGYIILSEQTEFDKTLNKDSVYLRLDSDSRICLTKINSTGIVEWKKSYPVEWENLKTLQLTNDGGYIAGGYTPVYDKKTAPRIFKTTQDRLRFVISKYDFVVFKFNSGGNLQWRKTYGSPKAEYLNCVRQMPDGGYLLGGYSFTPVAYDKTGINGKTHDLLIKIDSKGKQQWTKCYSDSTQGAVKDMQPCKDGGYLINELTSQPGKWSQFCVQKVDSKFRLQWKKYYGGSKADAMASLIPCTDGTIVLAGTTCSSDGDVKSGYRGNWDYWLVKINAQGEIIWEKTLGSPTDERLFNGERSSDGVYYLGGTTGHLVGPLDGDIAGRYPPEKVTLKESDVKSPIVPKVHNIWIVKVTDK